MVDHSKQCRSCPDTTLAELQAQVVKTWAAFAELQERPNTPYILCDYAQDEYCAAAEALWNYEGKTS